VGVLVVLLMARGWYDYGKTTTAFLAALTAVNAPVMINFWLSLLPYLRPPG